jgi:hypothetical protein
MGASTHQSISCGGSPIGWGSTFPWWLMRRSSSAGAIRTWFTPAVPGTSMAGSGEAATSQPVKWRSPRSPPSVGSTSSPTNRSRGPSSSSRSRRGSRISEQSSARSRGMSTTRWPRRDVSDGNRSVFCHGCSCWLRTKSSAPFGFIAPCSCGASLLVPLRCAACSRIRSRSLRDVGWRSSTRRVGGGIGCSRLAPTGDVPRRRIVTMETRRDAWRRDGRTPWSTAVARDPAHRVALAHAFRLNEHAQSAQDAGFTSPGTSMTKGSASSRV